MIANEILTSYLPDEDEFEFETGMNAFRPRRRPVYGEWQESDLDWSGSAELNSWMRALRSGSR
jgi:hypothetical protein